MRNGPLFFQRCTIFFFLFLLCSCKEREERKVQRSFYYWKTAFHLSPGEHETLNRLSVHRLYVKFFDVEWNGERNAPQPAAKSIFQQKPPAGITITPVVFITQEPLQKSSPAQLDTMAANIARLLQSLATSNQLALSNEVQIDCDWTAATKENYFHFLQAIQKQPFVQNKVLSATIRLHQLKFHSQTGVPPVQKGLLMCYNMGNLRYPQTKNSIIEESEFKKYIGHIENYPLALDVALPIFDWYILFDGNNYKGLVRDFSPGRTWAKKDRIEFASDTLISGYAFRKGQWLRHERSDAETIRNCAALLGKKIKANELTVILYHLDEDNLTNYTLHELESFYNRLR
ncbi:hypothetical protein [Flavisolibacter nicotianae]|uniref:hypothetical protein n=1 Tax=Flavisolibacter nicotianae TaxID=2364882 RepID=UPI000EADB1FA|nr:hypothetical protein [Flavisolibacter nicotianae]